MQCAVYSIIPNPLGRQDGDQPRTGGHRTPDRPDRRSRRSRLGGARGERVRHRRRREEGGARAERRRPGQDRRKDRRLVLGRRGEGARRLAPAFERRHPGTSVEVVDIGYDNAYDKITVGMKAGKGLPDVLTIEGGRLPGYIGAFPGGLYDLTPLAGARQAEFARAAWKDVTDERGKVFALPWDGGPCALYYRTDIFEKAGVDPAGIATWDDYVRAGEQIKARTGKKLLVMDPQEDSMFPMLLQQQGQGYVRGGRIAVSDRQAVRAATLLKTLADKDLVAFEKGWDGLVSATKAGKVATTPYAVWWSGTLTDEMPELKGRFGVVPLPAVRSGRRADVQRRRVDARRQRPQRERAGGVGVHRVRPRRHRQPGVDAEERGPVPRLPARAEGPVRDRAAALLRRAARLRDVRRPGGQGAPDRGLQGRPQGEGRRQPDRLRHRAARGRPGQGPELGGQADRRRHRPVDRRVTPWSST
ncbi:ABC transporter substrate-binding protein [Actinomadura luteofluorescens]|uniref:ABC transporter substrate-binding protein n=1 Tax=Actinomadura luteofluorescens TaxID=46163 RepID=UPI00363F6F9A